MNSDEAAKHILKHLSNESPPEEAADLYLPAAAVDLKGIPTERWPLFLMRSVALPPDVEKYVAGQNVFTVEELTALEDRIAAFHGVNPPFYITAEPGLPFDAWLGLDETEG